MNQYEESIRINNEAYLTRETSASYWIWKSFYVLTLFTFFTGSIIVIMYWYDLLISDRAKLGDVPVRTDVLDSIKDSIKRK